MNIKPSQNCEEFPLPNQATLPAWNEQGNGHYDVIPPEWSEHDNSHHEGTPPEWVEQGNGHHESIPPDWIDNPIKEQKPVEAVPNAGAWLIPLIAGLAFIWKVYLYWR